MEKNLALCLMLNLPLLLLSRGPLPTDVVIMVAIRGMATFLVVVASLHQTFLPFFYARYVVSRVILLLITGIASSKT